MSPQPEKGVNVKLIISTTRDGKPWGARADLPDNVVPQTAALNAWSRDVVNLIRNVGRQDNGKFLAEMLGNVAISTLLAADDLPEGIQKTAQLQVAKFVEQYAPTPKAPAPAPAPTPAPTPAAAPEAETPQDEPDDAETDDNPAPA